MPDKRQISLLMAHWFFQENVGFTVLGRFGVCGAEYVCCNVINTLERYIIPTQRPLDVLDCSMARVCDISIAWLNTMPPQGRRADNSPETLGFDTTLLGAGQAQAGGSTAS